MTGNMASSRSWKRWGVMTTWLLSPRPSTATLPSLILAPLLMGPVTVYSQSPRNSTLPLTSTGLPDQQSAYPPTLWVTVSPTPALAPISLMAPSSAMLTTQKLLAPCPISSLSMWVLSPVLSLWSAITTGVLPALAAAIALATPSSVLGSLFPAKGSLRPQM